MNFPNTTLHINNFIPNIRSFGPRAYMTEKNFVTEEEKPVPNGRKQPSQDDLQLYFFMGARGTYDDYKVFAQANGIHVDTVREIVVQTHLTKPAFMRMWILFPEFTERIMRNCLDDRAAPKNYDEEIFAAYTIMSKLVSANDPYVARDNDGIRKREEGYLDDWYLCR